jgi:hypothetical protein
MKLGRALRRRYGRSVQPAHWYDHTIAEDVTYAEEYIHNHGDIVGAAAGALVGAIAGGGTGGAIGTAVGGLIGGGAAVALRRARRNGS